MASRPRPTRVVVVGSVVVVVLVGAGIGAYAGTRPAHTAYRTGVVSTAPVTATLTLTGTATPRTVTAGFATAGTVRSVAVRAGQGVSAGQPLAQLDTTTLTAALDAAARETAEAALTVSQAEAGTLTAVGRSTGRSGGSTGGGGSSAIASLSVDTSRSAALLATATSGTSALAALVAGPGRPTTQGTSSTSTLLGAVTGGQRTLDADLATATGLLTAATAACASSATPTPTDSPTAGPSATPTTSPSAGVTAAPSRPTSPPTPTPTSTTTVQPGPADCLTAEATLLSAQQRVAGDERSLATAESTLDGALAKAVTAAGSSAGTGSTGRPGGTSSTSGTSGGSSTSGTTTVVSGAQLAAYQATVDAAQAAQAVAQQALDMATLRSPLGGTVLSVGLSVGASSSGEEIVVAAPGGVDYTAAVPVASIPRLAVGQTVSVLRDGVATPLPARISALAAAPDSSGDYAVTVTPDEQPAGVRSGSTASLTITLAAGTGMLTVPTSAVTTIGAVHVVRVLSGSSVRAVTVTLGTQGALRTQVSGKLTAGEKVVLADLDQAVPASNSDTTTRRTGLGGTGTGTGGLGALGGGGFSGGGFAGGGGLGGGAPPTG